MILWAKTGGNGVNPVAFSFPRLSASSVLNSAPQASEDLAQTCLAFSEPALDALWYELDDVKGSSTGSDSSEIPDASLFLSAGVEVLEVKVLDQPNYRVPNAIKRLICSPAEVVYYSGHGSSVGGKLLIDIHNKPCGGDHGTYRNWIGPGDLTSTWTNPIDLQILIIAGCSVLKIDFSTPTPSGTGLAWAKLLDTEGGPLVALLGYRGSTPCDNPKGDEIARKMAGRMSGGSTNFARDWLNINGNNNANNAVAMDAKGYWWIEGTVFGDFDIMGPMSIP